MFGSDATFLVPLLTALQAGGFLPSERNPFILRAEVLWVMENGPITVRLQLREVSGKRLWELRYSMHEYRSAFFAPRSWSLGNEVDVYGGGNRLGRYSASSGLGKTEFRFLHHEYAGIPSGAATALVKWPLYSRGDKTLIVPSPATVVRLDIPAATPANLVTLRQRMEAKWLEAGQSREPRQVFIESIRYSPHRELIPTAFKFLTSRVPPAEDESYKLADWLCSLSDEDAMKLLVATVAECDTTTAVGVFWAWRQRKYNIGAQQVKRLCESSSFWVPVLAFVTFPQQCDAAWKRGLREELARVHEPMTESRFKIILTDLNDGQFATRRKAFAELWSHGERMELLVREALRKPLPLETKRTLESFCREIELGDAPLAGKSVMQYLRSCESAEARDVLEQLSHSAPGSSIGRMATESLRAKTESKP